MSLVIYEPETPAIEIIGHAGLDKPGKDILCAAMSILMFTLCRHLPGIAVKSGEGWARLDGADLCRGPDGEKTREAFRLTAGGYRLLGENYPRHIIYQEKYHVRPD